MKSRDERVRLDAAKYYTARRMGWKETILRNGASAPKPRRRTDDTAKRSFRSWRSP